jgi:hypothetical protein
MRDTLREIAHDKKIGFAEAIRVALEEYIKQAKGANE